MSRKIWLVLLLCFVSSNALAFSLPGEVSVRAEPIFGYEWIKKSSPSPHVKGRVIYGARVIAGYRLLSLEAEVTRGYDQESYPTQGLTIRDTTDKIKLGLRMTYDVSELLSAHVRGGGQASRNKHEESQNGVDQTTIGKIQYDPYLGGGLNFSIGKSFSLVADVVIVIKDFGDLSQNEYQSSIGVSGKIF